MEMEGDRHKARRITARVKSRGQLFAQHARGLHRMETINASSCAGEEGGEAPDEA